MNYEAKIIVKEQPKHILTLLEKDRESDRSHYNVEEKDGSVLIHVKAKDGVAFRATMNTITQTLAIYHKTKDLP